MDLACTYAGAQVVPGTSSCCCEPVIDVDSNNARATLIDLCNSEKDANGDTTDSMDGKSVFNSFPT